MKVLLPQPSLEILCETEPARVSVCMQTVLPSSGHFHGDGIEKQDEEESCPQISDVGTRGRERIFSLPTLCASPFGGRATLVTLSSLVGWEEAGPENVLKQVVRGLRKRLERQVQYRKQEGDGHSHSHEADNWSSLVSKSS